MFAKPDRHNNFVAVNPKNVEDIWKHKYLFSRAYRWKEFMA